MVKLKLQKYELDMRTLYSSYEKALDAISNPEHRTNLLEILQTIQAAAIADTILSKDEEPLCTHPDPRYTQQNQICPTDEVIRKLISLISKIDYHKLQWYQLEPNKKEIKEFLDNAKRFAEDLLESITNKKKRITKIEKATKKSTPDDDPSVIDLLVEYLFGGNRETA